MEHSDIVRLGLIFAIQAEVEAMKVKNLEREQEGMSFAYNENHFLSKAKELRNISHSHKDQL